MIYIWPNKTSKKENIFIFFILLLIIIFFIASYKFTFGSYVKLEYSKSYYISVSKLKNCKGFLLNDEYWIWPDDYNDYDFISNNISAPFYFIKNKDSDKGLFIKNNDTIIIKMSFGRK